MVRADDVDPDGSWAEQVHTTGGELEALTGNPVQFVHVSTTDLTTAIREQQPLIASLRLDGRVLVGPDLKELLGAAS